MHIIYYLFGGFHLLFGTLMKIFDLGNLVITYSNKKYSKKELSNLGGNHLIFLGLILLLAILVFDLYIWQNPESEQKMMMIYDYFFILTHLLVVGGFYLRMKDLPFE